ncbi:FMN-binding protein Acg [Mycobacterium cookii]|uniref:Putative NAD(P)H nitroreductase acg n=1 Tax=Mycobacterium cookii TaxID=1775 RepID=A0A7I7KUW0_9MYCO|nr:NAD(P)H nitroreductase [Mycobacterium cookii]MCV7329971.1 NAD(P)H nitroreductase [Mycobacterium cookii]BBX45900.1 putative NAD(P)H nitroreductase acg [Mycobacterium cookii]
MLSTMVDTTVIEDAVRAACRAPSLHNSQPWSWVLDGRQLQLFLDRSRVMATDRSARQALISCGAALDHLRVAIAATGWQSHIKRFPDPGTADHLASVDFTPAPASDRDRRRAEAILTRHTDRLPFTGPPDWQSVNDSVVAAIGDTPVRLDALPEEARPQLVYATQLAESLRFYDIPYQDEIHWWAAPFEAAEGIPYSALVSAEEGERVGIDRTFPATHQRERRAEVPEDHAKILLLSTAGNARTDALAAGEALSAVLLECTISGLATCPVTHLTELDVTRNLIRAVVDNDDVPQILIRVGVAPGTDPEPAATPRRDLAKVLRVKH